MLLLIWNVGRVVAGSYAVGKLLHSFLTDRSNWIMHRKYKMLMMCKDDEIGEFCRKSLMIMDLYRVVFRSWGTFLKQKNKQTFI